MTEYDPPDAIERSRMQALAESIRFHKGDTYPASDTQVVATAARFFDFLTSPDSQEQQP